jgi:hypothetical protein
MWWPAVVKFPLRLDYGRSPHAYVNQRLQIQLELLMMSGVPLETCWAFNERWNNKFWYTVASRWLFLLSACELVEVVLKGFFVQGETKFELADGAVANGTVPGHTRLFSHPVHVSFRHNDMSWIAFHLLISSCSDEFVPTSSVVLSRTVPNAIHRVTF